MTSTGVKREEVLDIMQEDGDELVIDHHRKMQRISLLRDYFVPVLAFRMCYINCDDAASRRIQNGREEEQRALMPKKAIIGVRFVEEPDKGAITLPFPIIPTIIGVSSLPDSQQQIGPIIRHDRIESEFFRIRSLEDQAVLCLRGTKLVRVNAVKERFVLWSHSPWFRITAIKEPAPIGTPGNRAIAHPTQHFRVVALLIDLTDMEFLPIAATG